MRTKFSILLSVTSRYFVSPLYWIVTVVLVLSFFFVRKPSELYAFCLTAFGIAATLAGVCYNFKSQVREHIIQPRILESADRFLLTALMSLVLLLISYCKDTVLESRWWLTSTPGGALAFYIFLAVPWCVIAVATIRTCYRGFDVACDELLASLRHRREKKDPELLPGKGCRRD
jgi:ABC-type Fe3+-siderophore transport system permease subunit